MATAINTSTAVGYSTTYLANTNSTSRGGSIYNTSTTTASGIGNATSLLNITGNTSFNTNSATVANSSNNIRFSTCLRDMVGLFLTQPLHPTLEQARL